MRVAVLVRGAIPDDYGTFARLFPELRVPDTVPSAEEFEREMMPSTFVAIHRSPALSHCARRRSRTRSLFATEDQEALADALR